MRFPRIRGRAPFLPPSFLLFGTLAVSLILSGCDLLGGGSDDPNVDVMKPAALHPEADLFSIGEIRTFNLTQGIDRSTGDTTFSRKTVVISDLGDTTVGAVTMTRVALTGSPAPASALTQLGLNPSRLRFDSLTIPDPGPGLRFPESPSLGWSLDTTVGDLRHVRRLTKVEIVRAAETNQECWVFVDSVYWNSSPVALETWWMGATGLVKHRREWKSYAPGGIPGGTLWRELKASN